MMPWGHFATALLSYTAYTIYSRRSLPSKSALLVLLLATQLPDLVDKPLGWYLGVIPTGRAFAHSFVIAVPLVVVVSLLAYRHGRPGLGAVFTFGYLVHLPGDYYTVAFSGNVEALRSLYWPLVYVEPIDYGSDFSHVAFLGGGSIAIAVVAVAALGLVYAYPSIRVTRGR